MADASDIIVTTKRSFYKDDGNSLLRLKDTLMGISLSFMRVTCSFGRDAREAFSISYRLDDTHVIGDTQAHIAFLFLSKLEGRNI